MTEVTLEVIDERLKNFIEENTKEHESILVQTTKTNGKVAAISRWQERLIGAWLVFSVMIIPVFVIVVAEWIIKAFVK
jgi:hypothetical protein